MLVAIPRTYHALQECETSHLQSIDRKPTVADPCGSYQFIDAAGKWWGCYYVGRAWTGQKFVADADPRDGHPW